MTVVQGEKTENIPAQKVLVCIGFAPNSENLWLEEIGVKLTRGFVDIDERMASTVPGIYAIGDVTGKVGLAHAASAQGIVSASTGVQAPMRRRSPLRPACTTSTSPTSCSWRPVP